VSNSSRLKQFGARLREDQVNFLNTLPNASLFVREAIDLAVNFRRKEIFENCRRDLFGERVAPQSSVSGQANVILLKVPNEVWSDAALKAKVDQGATLDELLSFLHSHLHPLFVDAVDGHLTSGGCGTYSQESRQSPEQNEENTKRGG